ncbi:MAG: phage tail protein [Alphaproteobacteria bacterium]|nr:MAG: phage tail protein [Alphaproteobacteria bacterium]
MTVFPQFDVYVGDIRPVSFSFAPPGWALCQGQTLAIKSNEELFSVIGTTYGGDGITTFCLPNLCSRAMVATGPTTGVKGAINYTLGETGGEEVNVLGPENLPAHSHKVSSGTDLPPQPGPHPYFGPVVAQGMMSYADDSQTPTMLDPDTLSSTGAGLGVANIQPYLVINYIIAVVGLFPHRG